MGVPRGYFIETVNIEAILLFFRPRQANTNLLPLIPITMSAQHLTTLAKQTRLTGTVIDGVHYDASASRRSRIKNIYEGKTPQPDPFDKAQKTGRNAIVVLRPWQHLQLEKLWLEDLRLEELEHGSKAALDLSPIERWEQELIREQPWNIVGVVAGGYFCGTGLAKKENGADDGISRAAYCASTNDIDLEEGMINTNC